jgi:hypothetical protein
MVGSRVAHAAAPRCFDSFDSHFELSAVKVEQWHFMRNAWRQDNGFNNQRQREGGREMRRKKERERRAGRRRRSKEADATLGGKRFSMRRGKKRG